MADQVASLQIHGFGDRSKVAYAAVMSKARFAPLMKQTFPRLKRLAPLMLTRLVQGIRESLQPVVQANKVLGSTDSMTTMHWIKEVDKE